MEFQSQVRKCCAQVRKCCASCTDCEQVRERLERLILDGKAFGQPGPDGKCAVSREALLLAIELEQLSDFRVLKGDVEKEQVRLLDDKAWKCPEHQARHAAGLAAV